MYIAHNYKKLKVREEALKYYFYFIQERMNIFWATVEGTQGTSDDTLLRHRFTNVYRACDRVSQYLIQNVIYPLEEKNVSASDILLNILVFKIFNKISTWEYLKSKFGFLRTDDFEPILLAGALSEKIKSEPIFNAAYIMTASSDKYRHLDRKHTRWLEMVKIEMIHEMRFDRIIQAHSLNEVFDILSECTFVGPFLAYQYAIDFNYSSVVNFSENSFVKAGIGAERGIKKCFIDVKKSQLESCIEYVSENFETLSKKYNVKFRPLPGRLPTLIDLQNCFCETDKLLRVKIPELDKKSTRIKQVYKPSNKGLLYQFPRKWGVKMN